MGTEPSRTIILGHYDEADTESVLMIKVADKVAMRVLDIVDCLDFFKVWLRVALFNHPTFGASNKRAYKDSRPFRWEALSSDSSDKDVHGAFNGKTLNFPNHP